MKVSVKRSGGFAGLTREWAVDVDEQPDADEWMSLLSSLPWDARPRRSPEPDRYIYVVRVSRRRVTIPEAQLAGPWRDLVERVRQAAD